MELDWYHDKLSVNAVLTPTSSFKWMSSFGDSGRQSPSRLLSILNLKTLRGYDSGDEYSPRGRNLSSPKTPGDVKCRRSLSGGEARCHMGSPSSSSSLSSLSPSSTKSHVCFGCVLHSYAE
ncbi:unnamed protein product [Calypogeia fissa]